MGINFLSASGKSRFLLSGFARRVGVTSLNRTLVKVKMGRWRRLLRPDETGPLDSRGRLSPHGSGRCRLTADSLRLCSGQALLPRFARASE